MKEYYILIDHMEKRRKERKRKREEKEERKEMILELLGFFSFPVLVVAVMFI